MNPPAPQKNSILNCRACGSCCKERKISAELVWGKNARTRSKNKGTLAFFPGPDNLVNVSEMADYHTHL